MLLYELLLTFLCLLHLPPSFLAVIPRRWLLLRMCCWGHSVSTVMTTSLPHSVCSFMSSSLCDFSSDCNKAKRLSEFWLLGCEQEVRILLCITGEHNLNTFPTVEERAMERSFDRITGPGSAHQMWPVLCFLFLRLIASHKTISALCDFLLCSASSASPH